MGVEGQNTFAIDLCCSEAPSSDSKPSIGSVFVRFGSVGKDFKVEMGQNAMIAGWSGHSGSPEEGWFNYDPRAVRPEGHNELSTLVMWHL